ncbi:50S ribosomal protein L25 [Synechococcales cyanobacterium C]|uniref:Large ribosomal subunit protein bL25 n=1 Tax=Petrachloros mirabilis ULC683 TaxID=2781853 RepID=A0A8K1ZXU5_9CYAN|nr:50S ribosomal protein L25 [Petrachloros mirabilis]NCJ07290.1 50S ribosomal protein L25 [Petrachloros mirabilis ULC683]
MEFAIVCEPREPGINPRKLRRMGQIPVVLYGHNGTESVSLMLSKVIADKMLNAVEVNNTLINVEVPKLSLNFKSLLRDVQKHSWKDELHHLSFFAISGKDSVTTTVPLHFIGEPIGVKFEDGSLDLVLNSLQLQCDPQNIPESIDIDISHLKVGDSIHVGELVLPVGVVAIGEDDRVVTSILAPAGGSKPSASDHSDHSDDSPAVDPN